MTHRRLLGFLTALFLASSWAHAQTFGQNRLVIRDYPYRIWETEHFQIHYYEENPLLLEECARYLEEAYDEVTTRLKAKPKEKLPFFLYTNHNEFEQTRIVDIGEGTGGVTEAFKDRLLIFNDGSSSWLRHVIFHEFTHEIEFAILHAGFWKSARLLKSILYPLWMMEGASEYFSGNIDEATDLMYARDAVTSTTAPLLKMRDLHNFNHLKPNQITKGYKQGARMIEYIADEFGEEKIRQLFESFRERFDTPSVLLDVLGMDDERFDRNFEEWMQERYGGPSHDLEEPFHYGERLTKPEPPIPVFHYSPVLSKDGGLLYTIGMREGYPAVLEQNVRTAKRRELIGRNFKELDWIALDARNLALSADGRYLYFVGEKNLVDFLYRYNILGGGLEKRSFAGLAALKNPAAHPADSSRLVLSGMENGFNDLYLVDFDDGKILERLTADPQDDAEPAFLPGGSEIVYSSEVGISSAGYSNRDLFRWRASDKLSSRLTQAARSERSPVVSGDGSKVAFLSDETGSWDFYEIDLSSPRVTRKTGVLTGIISPSYDISGSSVIFAAMRDGEIHVYQGSSDNFLSIDVSGSFLPAAAPPAGHESPETSPEIFYSGPYKTRFGTDLFFPAFLFSTQGGLFLLSYWQGSDMLGYHTLSNNLTLNSGVGYLDYSLGYSFARYRPEFLLLFKGTQYRDYFELSDQGEDLYKKEHLQAFLMGYPLSKFQRLETGLTVVERYHSYPSDPDALTNLQGLEWSVQFSRDTTTAPYLVVTKGSRFALGVSRAFREVNFDLDYWSKAMEWHHFFPIGKDGTVVSRLAHYGSYGENYEVFPLGGQGGVRGYAREDEDSRKRDILVYNLEARIPLFPDLNYHMWYLFPDFYIKNIYLGLFSDQGVRWSDRVEDFIGAWPERRRDDFFQSLGMSLKFNTFILETFPFFFSLEWAKRTTTNGGVLYGSIYQYFTFK
ncbi:MAG: PD40 domain-containing protein [Elusimicrobia bacterium]|nr:PD40 domain-containing protein [Elusimicrobiota bacterium]